MTDKVEKCPNCEAERKRRVEAEASVEQLGDDLKASQMDYANEHRLREAAEANCRNLESALEEKRSHRNIIENGLRADIDLAHKICDEFLSEKDPSNPCATCRDHSIGYRMARVLEVAEKEARMWEERTKEAEIERDNLADYAKRGYEGWDMYQNAWLREMGGVIRHKWHQIDGFVLRMQDIYEKAKLVDRIKQIMINEVERQGATKDTLFNEVFRYLAESGKDQVPTN